MFNLLSKESHENMFCTKFLIYSRCYNEKMRKKLITEHEIPA